MLLALMVFINIPRDFYHSCDVALELHHKLGLSFSEGHEDCLVCDYTFSVFSSDSQTISTETIAEYGQYQSFAIALYASDSFPYCEGRAPPVLA
jgi:hypothetical protein